MDLLFGFSGRIGRGKWWLAESAIVLIWALIVALFAAFVGVVDPSSEHAAGELSNGGLSVGVALLAGIVLNVWINVAATVKRFHDRDKSGVWFCIVFVPIIGPIWQIVECGMLPGNPGSNSYGPPPGGGGGGFATEVEAHIARMKAEQASMRGIKPERLAAAAAPTRMTASVPQTAPPRRPAGPAGFGRRTV